MTTNTHGGPRPGAGRPSNASKGEPKRVKRNVYLSQEAERFLKDYAARHELGGWGYAVEEAAELLKEKETEAK